jgi:hypothetical protein
MASSKGLTILALIIGIGGLGMSGYTLLFALPVKTQSTIQNIWYVSNSDSVSINDFDTIIPDLSITATVNPGESLHIFFNSDVFFYSQSGIEILYVYISLNGIKVAPPVATFGAEFGIKVWGTLSLQYSNLTISPGLYNIGIIAYIAGDGTPEESLYDMTLLAFTCA